MYRLVELDVSVTVTLIDTTSIADRKVPCCARITTGATRAVARSRMGSGLCFMVRLRSWL
jgi:hypothetical protein